MDIGPIAYQFTRFYIAHMENHKSLILAEDVTANYLIAKKALECCMTNFSLVRVKDGEELIDFLKTHEAPDLVLLDLNMPRKNGFEVLAEMKKDKTLRGIPVVVISTSSSEEDVKKAYAKGASSYFTKPSSFAEFKDMMRQLSLYWFEWSKLPTERSA